MLRFQLNHLSFSLLVVNPNFSNFFLYSCNHDASKDGGMKNPLISNILFCLNSKNYFCNINLLSPFYQYIWITFTSPLSQQNRFTDAEIIVQR